MTDELMTVAETAPFIRQAAKLWTEDDRNAFVDFIAANPDVGDVIPDTGGLRKVRWGRAGMGKRGGVRIIYFYHDDSMPRICCLSTRKPNGKTGPGMKSGAPGR
jgi:hypothetical protein